MVLSKNLAVKTGIKYGVALGATVISIGIIRYKTGMILRDNQILSYLFWIIFALTIFYAVFRYKKHEPLSFTFKQTVRIGLIAGLITGLMYTVYIFILNNYIDTELCSKIIQFKEQALALDNPTLSKKEITELPDPMKMSSARRGLVYTFVCMTCGVIYSVLGTIITKKLGHKSQ
jgi:hypothetical protein